MSVPKGFKQTEVGIIPQDWEVKKLSDVSSMKSGEAITSKNIHNADKYPCFGGNGLRGYTSSYTHDGYFALVGRQGALCGNVQFSAGKFFASEHAVVVTPEEQTDIKLLYYILLAMNLNQYSESSAQPGLSVEKINKLPIPIPPTKSEQTAIAVVLSDTDALIEGVEKLLEKKRWIKQGAMQELLKPKEGWKEIRLDSAADIDNDNLSSSSDPNFIFHYISLEDVDNGFLKGATEMIFKNAPSRARRRVKKGDVLVSTVRPNLKSHFLVKDDVKNYICSTGFSLVRCDKEKLIPGYLFNHLFASFINQQIDSVISGSNYPAINTSHVKSLKIPIPTSIAEQERIAAVLSDMDSEIEQLENRLAKYRKLKTGMMQELLTGKKRLL